MMTFLAIDTSTDKASVALKVNEHVYFKEQDSQKTHAQVLLPIIDTIMHEASVSLPQLDGIIFGCGPGSFTGLRIACSIAKGLAYPDNIPLIPVSTLATIAWMARDLKQDMDTPVLSILDARMHELYWSYFSPRSFATEHHVSKAENIFLDEKKPLLLAGLGIPEYASALSDSIQSDIIEIVPLYPNAKAMIELVVHAKIKPVSIELAQPIYVRNTVTQGGSHG